MAIFTPNISYKIAKAMVISPTKLKKFNIFIDIFACLKGLFFRKLPVQKTGWPGPGEVPDCIHH